MCLDLFLLHYYANSVVFFSITGSESASIFLFGGIAANFDINVYIIV